MKKISIFSILTLIILLISGCTVNSVTGGIHIKNSSDTEVKNIRIGDTIICLYIAPGSSYDYYFFTTIKGKLTADGATSGYVYNGHEYKINGDYTVKTNKWYDCKIEDEDGKTYIDLGKNEKQNDFYDE